MENAGLCGLVFVWVKGQVLAEGCSHVSRGVLHLRSEGFLSLAEMKQTGGHGGH